MNITFSGYQIAKKLHESDHSLVYRGLRQVDKQPVILKILKELYPPPEKIAWFKREYEVICNLNLTGVVNAYSLERDGDRWVMVLEDFGGKSLAQLMQAQETSPPTPLLAGEGRNLPLPPLPRREGGLEGLGSLADFLTVAIQVSEILGQIHQQNIIHKDINPANIILNHTTGQVKLIDFGISTVISRENATFRNPNVLEGTLAYISPEQTGRMNRPLDYRTDLYSLGVTFYQLLTGQLPFPTDDAMELVHCHIAKVPLPPHQLKPDIPQAISEIVLKLMAKNAEDRYQSASGLKADLEQCLHQWQRKKQIDPFPLGRADASDRFQIPQKLYGREKEIEMLLASFERVSLGACELMLVAGYSGIGKSALVQEVYKPITGSRGYFIAGKFDLSIYDVEPETKHCYNHPDSVDWEEDDEYQAVPEKLDLGVGDRVRLRDRPEWHGVIIGLYLTNFWQLQWDDDVPNPPTNASYLKSQLILIEKAVIHDSVSVSIEGDTESSSDATDEICPHCKYFDKRTRFCWEWAIKFDEGDTTMNECPSFDSVSLGMTPQSDTESSLSMTDTHDSVSVIDADTESPCHLYSLTSVYHPLIPLPTSWTNVNQSESILVSERKNLYFRGNVKQLEEYRKFARQANQNKCRAVGLSLGKDGLEYPLWVIMESQSSQPFKIKHINVKNQSQDLPPEFLDAELCATFKNR